MVGSGGEWWGDGAGCPTAVGTIYGGGMIHRIEVTPRPTETGARLGGSGGGDPLAEHLRRQIAAATGADAGDVVAGRVYLIDSDATPNEVRRAADRLLADPVTDAVADEDAGTRIEVHLKPGVTDPVAASATAALRELGLDVRAVRTGRSYRIAGDVAEDVLDEAARRVLANGVIEDVHFAPHRPETFPAGRRYTFELGTVPLAGLDDAALARLSRDGHLFLNAAEMRAAQDHFAAEGRDPTDCELETLAQTWSEHCVHKTLKSRVIVRDRSGKELRRYGNLIKETIFASTREIMGRGRGRDGESERRRDEVGPTSDTSSLPLSVSPSLPPTPFCLSVFVDNAGVIAFDETHAVCFKVETHNRPSALDPYGGAATGIGGVIRDVLGTGLGAKPFANTDAFCVAPPDLDDVPKGVIHPKRILEQVVAGVRDYGNRMGIPTVNGAVHFDERYVGNPLVFCGCAGLLPNDKVQKAARRGDAIVVMGGRTGRDGIHGATFSSAGLTSGHAAEFSHAVQIGNPIVEKQLADVLLAARDHPEGCLFTAVTDCGAGGLSSAVGEMGEATGARVDLDKVPLKYAGLSYTEIWISEAQERMVLAVPPADVHALLQRCRAEDVEATVIGTFGGGPPDDPRLVLEYHRNEVCDLPMALLHDGVPMPEREAVVSNTSLSDGVDIPPPTRDDLLEILAHPTVASKHWVVRQYDHEVGGGSAVKPLVGPHQRGPSDAAVVRPKLTSRRGVVLSNGLAPQIADAYAMTIAAIDEAVRNAVCVGADLGKLALLDNFCWPGTDDAEAMGTLVLACEACRDYALALNCPFVSGKDSLHNQFTDRATGRVIKIPPTMLISAIGVIEDVGDCVTMDLKSPGSVLVLVGCPAGTDLDELREVHESVVDLIADGRIRAAHDVSDGGPLAAVAEMCIASGHGAALAETLPAAVEHDGLAGYVLECVDADAVLDGVLINHIRRIGRVTDDATLTTPDWACPVADLTAAWRGTLDW